MQLGSRENENERFAHYLRKTFKKTASLIANSCKAVSIVKHFICMTFLRSWCGSVVRVSECFIYELMQALRTGWYTSLLYVSL